MPCAPTEPAILDPVSDDQRRTMNPMTPRQTQDGPVFAVGERFLVTGGYNNTPAWLGGGEGYVGTIDEIEGERIVVKLDEAIVLEAENGAGWLDFGSGSAHEIGRLATARG